MVKSGYMNKNSLEQSILSALCYFDVFDYPLTLLEIWQWLFDLDGQSQAYNLVQVGEALKDTSLTRRVSSSNGLYFLNGREEIVTKRLNRYAIAGEKNQIARRGARALSFLPFVKLVCVCNHSGNNNTRRDSDIDLFIVTTPNRLYLTRFLVTIALSVLRLRRHGKKVTDRLCLSFYASEDDLEFDKLKIGQQDSYLVYWIANLFPIYDRGGYDKFLEKNKWIKKSLPNHLPKDGSFWRRVSDSRWSKASVSFFEIFLSGFLGNYLEVIMRKAQLLKMSSNKKSLAVENDTRVVISNTMLKFHENDRRKMYQNDFEKKIAEII